MYIANDFETIISNPIKLNKTTLNIEKWLSMNQMKPNFKETHLLSFKADLNAKLSDYEITNCTWQRDRGLNVALEQ